MPFGLKNVPATFQRALDIIVATVKWRHALAYMYDITIFAPTPGHHVHYLKSILNLIKKVKMTLKLKKCHSFSDAIDYLGHVITSGQMHVLNKTKQTIRTFKYATNLTRLLFSGQCKVYRRFVSKFVRKVAPLNNLLKKRKPAEIRLT